MDPYADLRDLTVPATYVFAIVVIFGEFFVLAALRKPYSHRSGFASLMSGGASFLMLFLADRAFYAAVFSFAYAHRLTTLPVGPLTVLLTFLVYDFAFYVVHRAGHEVRLIWCFHAVHHTSDEMRLSSAVRGSAFDFLYLPWLFALIPLLGVHPSLLLVVESFARMWGIATHVSPHLVGRVAWLERFLVTPSVHRVHHGNQPDYLDRNYAEVLTLWDHLFGTYQPEVEPPVYGLTTKIDADALPDIHLDPFRALVRDVRAASTLRAKLRVIFDAPGWSESEDGRNVTVRRRAGRV